MSKGRYPEHIEDRHLRAQLVFWRIMHGLRREDVAERMGINVEHVGHFEEGMTDPRLSTLRLYMLAIGVLVRYEVGPEPTGRHRAGDQS